MKWKETGFNKYREAFVFVPRKNGKSFLCSVFANYLLIADKGQHDLFTYAVNAQQARLVFDGAKQMIVQNKALKKRSKVMAHHIDHTKTNSRLKPVSSNSGGNEGLGGTAIGDELHTHPDSSMFDVMQLSMAARRKAWHFIITTAGTNTTSFCKQYYDQCKTIESESTFTAIYELDDEKEIEQPETWIKANPNLGISVYSEEIADTLEKARTIPHRYSEVLTKRFNIWRNGEQEFIAEKDWLACYKPKECKPSNELPVFIGIDLSSASDISAVWCVQGTGASGEVRIWGKCYLPSSALERGKKNSEIYQQWVRQGHLTVAGDRTVDYEHIERDIHSLCDQYDVHSVSFDPWNSNFLLTRLESHGVPVEKVRQGFISLSPPTKALQVAVMQEKVIHDNNPILNWAVGNVTLSTDAAANIKPDKMKSENKIDPVAALLNGYRTWMLETESGELSDEVLTVNW
ncbi:terminase large subunit [Psychromonas sp. KJ10-2]|uniref:terminase large subunit n=1 Tax=Psychromonas sp. KJ10-2 TaxID=3391822 RepID=UPI0039B6CD4B